MENAEFILALAGILGVVIQLLLIVASIVLVSKDRNAGTILMLLGSILMLFNLFATFLIPILFVRNGIEFLAKSVVWQKVFDQLPFFLYVLGVLIYAIRIPKKV